ncbi:MAG: alpha/beta hydrolase [Bacilli bacterium]|nr:alpha/beta hydrolase [Bacilli bacterium]
MPNKTFFSKPMSILLSLIIILISCLIASGVQTDHGNVKISDVRFVGDYGNQLSGLLYQPANFDPKKKLPAVLTAHGYINSREVQDAFDIEFARRGYVVLSMDMEGHGYSEQVPYDPTTRGTLSGLSYLRNLGFVDNTKIALEGHSMGGWSILAAAGAKPEWVNTVIQEGSSPETYGTPKVLANTPFNYAIVYSKYDEFAPLMWEIPKASQIVNTDKLKNAFGTKEAVVLNKLYGSYENKSARMLYQPAVIHPGDHWSKEAVGNAIEFLQNAMPAPKPDNFANQTWRMKEYATFAALIGAFMLLISVAGNLLKTNFFRTIAEPMPDNKGIRSKGSWIISALIAAAIPTVTFFKFQAWGSTWFVPGSFWPQSLTNGFVVWVVLNALIGVVLFTLWHFISNKKTGATLNHYGISFAKTGYLIDLKIVGKSALLAIYSVGIVYLLTVMADSVFHLDFRIWILALKVMGWAQVVIMLKYMVPFLIYFLVNGVILHGQLRLKESNSEAKTAWKWFLANASINSLGIIVLILIQYIPLFVNEQLYWPSQALLGIVAFQFVPVNIVVSLISTYFFRKTGKIYSGAFVNTLLITWYIVAGQATQYAGGPVSNTWSIVFVIVSVILVVAGLFVKRTVAQSREQSINA